jgi:phenazine biosynthesis protein phzE
VPGGPFRGRTAIVVDAEDGFAGMLADQLRHLGLTVDLTPWDTVTTPQIDSAELVISGPGPGDPRDTSTPRNQRPRHIINRRRDAGRPLLATGLSHQILARTLGITLVPLDIPDQGTQKTVDIFGTPQTLGFYNTFTARVPAGTTTVGKAQIAADPVTGDVHALRGPGFVSVQGHVESILSHDGTTTLEWLITATLGPAQI